MALMSQARSGYNGTSDITASAPPPASWRGRGRARASASGYKVLMTEAQEASYTAAASERVFPVRQLTSVLCFQTNSCDDAGSGPAQLHSRGGRPGAGVGRSV